MMEFFEFLNTCSPLRASSYLFFIFVIVFTILSFITNIIKHITNKPDDTNDVDWFKNNQEFSDSE